MPAVCPDAEKPSVIAPFRPIHRPNAYPLLPIPRKPSPGARSGMADAGYQSRKLARELKRRHGWQLKITQRRQRAFKVVGLTWIVERTFAWLGRNRRLSKDYEFKVQTSEAFIDLAAIRLMLKRLAPG